MGQSAAVHNGTEILVDELDEPGGHVGRSEERVRLSRPSWNFVTAVPV
jgi:hypothetical protein